MCNILHMPTNLAIDDDLLEKALKLGKFKSKRETVNKALELLIRHLLTTDTDFKRIAQYMPLQLVSY